MSNFSVFSSLLESSRPQHFLLLKFSHEAKQQRKKLTLKFRWEFICVDGAFDVAKVSYSTVTVHIKVVSWECFVGIPQSLFKKVQLNSTALARPRHDFVFKMVASTFAE